MPAARVDRAIAVVAYDPERVPLAGPAAECERKRLRQAHPG
jgi:hypothetical protein